MTSDVENSVLWKVSHPDSDLESYLLGTIHLMCEEEFFIPEKVLNIMDKVDEVSFEVNLSDAEEIASAIPYIMGKKKLTETLTESQQTEVDEILRSHLNLTINDLDAYTITAVWTMIIDASLPCESKTPYEMELLKLAQERSLKISGLEKISTQFECLNNAYNTEEYINQIKLLPDYQDIFLTAFEDYKNEDIQAVGEKYTSEKFMDKNAFYWLLEERNNRWAKIIPHKTQKNSTLFAVGAAHLIGEDGLIHLLEMEGYNVEPVFE